MLIRNSVPLNLECRKSEKEYSEKSLVVENPVEDLLVIKMIKYNEVFLNFLAFFQLQCKED